MFLARALRPDMCRDEEVIGSPDPWWEDILLTNGNSFEIQLFIFFKIFSFEEVLKGKFLTNDAPMSNTQINTSSEYFVYILYSEKVDRFYVGQSDNILERMCDHLSGQSPYIPIAKDWVLMHTETYSTRTESLIRENAIKRKKSRKSIEWIISQSASSRHASEWRGDRRYSPPKKRRDRKISVPTFFWWNLMRPNPQLPP